MSRSKDKAATVNYGDHEVIVPENKLRVAVSKASPQDDDDPIARAEKALAALSPEFGTWMDSECERLDGARREIVDSGFTAANKEALFRAAHDIKGEAATFGYPAVAAAADSLCRLVEHAPDPARIPTALIDQHVDAVRAICREYGHSDAQKLATALTKRLREVTDDFLLKENRNRPEVLRQLKSPPIIPR
ncbi:MAG TPA: Hpt domain-containing protein [Pseudolabrys sp.]|nr:Hpt domain-containing protein [Pseudolabrys sp.]